MAQNSLETGDVASLRTWLTLAQRKISLKNASKDLESLKSRVSYLGMRFDELKGKNDKYQRDAVDYLASRKKNKRLVGADLMILKHLAIQKYRQKKYTESKQLLESYEAIYGSPS